MSHRKTNSMRQKMSHRKTKSMRQKNVAQKNELNETKCRTEKRTQCDKIYKNLFGKV